MRMRLPRRHVVAKCTSRQVVKVYKNPETVCKDCVYYKPHDRVCAHLASTSVDIVHGDVYFLKAMEMRNNETLCGRNAKYFQKENVFIRDMRVFWTSDEIANQTRNAATIMQFIVIYLMVTLIAVCILVVSMKVYYILFSMLP